MLKSYENSTPADLKLFFLDGLRGLAACYVMVAHSFLLLWEGPKAYLQHPEQYTLAGKILATLYPAFTYGREVVVFFFVLSGFVIHLKYAHQYAINPTAPFAYKTYLKRRTFRIYPLFLFALLLTALVDWLGRSAHYSIYAGTTGYPRINNALNPDWSTGTFVGNLFFLFKTYVPIYGTNGTTWSLQYEWWFYMLYPLLLLMGRKKAWYPLIVVGLLFFASFFSLYWPEKMIGSICARLPLWWLGTILADIYVGRLPIKLIHLGWFIPAVFLAPALNQINYVLGELAYALFFTGILALLLNLSYRSPVTQLLGRLKWTGQFSYTLFLIHFPLFVFVSGWLMQQHNGHLPHGFTTLLISQIAMIALAWVLHFITERPFTAHTFNRRPI